MKTRCKLHKLDLYADLSDLTGRQPRELEDIFYATAELLAQYLTEGYTCDIPGILKMDAVGKERRKYGEPVIQEKLRLKLDPIIRDYFVPKDLDPITGEQQEYEGIGGDEDESYKEFIEEEI